MGILPAELTQAQPTHANHSTPDDAKHAHVKHAICLQRMLLSKVVAAFSYSPTSESSSQWLGAVAGFD
jgi:hypothetical protein